MRRHTRNSFFLATYRIIVASAFYLAASRSAEMYITVDEAMTYIDHVLPKTGLFDFSAANNHFLNTLLVKAFTFLSPYNELAIRLPGLLVGLWFFWIYLPRRISNITVLIITTIICIAPTYISEYWSLSRGYFMSGCFAMACLLEANPQTKANNITSDGKMLWYAALSTLSSFSMLPFSFTANAYSYLTSGETWKQRWSNSSKRKSFWFLQFSLILSFVAIRTFQTSGEALSKANSMSLFSPFEAVLNSPVIGSSSLALAAFVLFIAGSLVSLFVLEERALRQVEIIFVSLLILYITGSVTGGFPAGRSWIPYWFPVSAVMGNLFYLRIFSQANLYSIAMILLASSLYIASIIGSYTSHYTNYWRSNDYQVKALFFHSARSGIPCLEERDLGDKVLMFYWDDPKSAIIRPRACKEGERSPYGFSNFDVPARRFDFPRKIYGGYNKSTHTGWYIDNVMIPK